MSRQRDQSGSDERHVTASEKAEEYRNDDGPSSGSGSKD